METTSTLYTCPMHPEVVRNSPGACPICGMALEPKIAPNKVDDKELKAMSLRFWLSVVLTLPILLLTMGMHIPLIAGIIQRIPPHISSWLQFLLATPVSFLCGWLIFQRAWFSIINRHLNMFSLIALGVGIAYGYSVIALIFPNLVPNAFHAANGEVNLYFEAAAAITTLVLLGQVLELRGRAETSGAIRALLDLAPKMAIKINSDGTEQEIPLEQIQVGDHLRVHPGEKIPTDGTILDGHAVIDESMITGESMPVEKMRDMHVIGGTINQVTSFPMRADRVGSETMLAQIIQQVAEAQRSQAPIQRLVDTFSAYFVPAVILVAIVTFFVWLLFGSMSYGLISAISVLIIACPCALGLATPMSVMVGIGRGAQMGVLIRNAESLERFEKVNALVIDKTGTLTAGKPSVNSIIPTVHFTENQILILAASLEQGSEHPLAEAIVHAAQVQGLNLQKVEGFFAEIGKGVKGNIDGKNIALGNIKLLELLNLHSNTLEDEAEKLRLQGNTVMFVVVDNKIVGLIAVADPIKPSTPLALKILHSYGLHIVMVTGDNHTTAAVVAKKLNIDNVEAEILPQQKNEIIKHLQQQGYVVAMAGDGINDAPALSAADVGIAMGTGTDIAMQSAGITLVRGDLMGIARAYQLSKMTMLNIRENLFLAVVYNVLCIPIAAGVLYPWTGLLLNPIIAAAAMSLSSVSVIGNALRLRHYSSYEQRL